MSDKILTYCSDSIHSAFLLLSDTIWTYNCDSVHCQHFSCCHCCQIWYKLTTATASTVSISAAVRYDMNLPLRQHPPSAFQLLSDMIWTYHSDSIHCQHFSCCHCCQIYHSDNMHCHHFSCFQIWYELTTATGSTVSISAAAIAVRYDINLPQRQHPLSTFLLLSLLSDTI
jgi:hypothetical protein